MTRPKKARILSSSELLFLSEGKHALVDTYSSDGIRTYECVGPGDEGLAVILSPTSGILLTKKDDEIETKTVFEELSSISSKPSQGHSAWKVQKQKDTLIVSYGEDEILSFSFPPIEASCSVAMIATCPGEWKFSSREEKSEDF